MTTQPEALRLADRLESDFIRSQTMVDAAAELRRLHAENERLHQINWSHEMKLSVRGYEIQIADLAAQRDALLEALRPFAANKYTIGFTHEDVDRARDAIKMVEETK